jgi:hypothetical protein
MNGIDVLFDGQGADELLISEDIYLIITVLL